MNDMTLRVFLETLQGRRVFFDPLHGNHGDHLLRLAAESMLKDADLIPVTNPQSSDFILLNGGGSMADGWFGLDRLARYSKEFPSHPLAVMPSSFYPTRSRLVDITHGRKAPMWLWAREQPSLDILEAAGFDDNVSLGLDHDLAFALDQHPMIRDLKNVPAQNIALIVERDDWEGCTGRGRPLSPPGLDFIPEKIRAAVRKTLLSPYRKRQDRKSPFRTASLRFVSQNHPEFMDLEPFVADISLAETCGFEDFLHYIARASVIITTRLHVAILGHMLKRRTYLVAGGYHKFRGVFDYSMQGGSTRFLRWDDDELKQ